MQHNLAINLQPESINRNDLIDYVVNLCCTVGCIAAASFYSV